MKNGKTAIVIPCIRRFEKWADYADQLGWAKKNTDIFVLGEQTNYSGVTLPGGKVSFIGRKIYGKDLPFSIRGLDWIYAKIWASKKYERVISFDDDTAPATPAFFTEHMAALGNKPVSTDFVNPLSGAYPRGLPYCDRKQRRVMLHQGLWVGDSDIGALDKLDSAGDLFMPPNEPINYGIVPHGKGITVCSMNISFKPEIIPAFFQAPMWRYDDIWSGLIVKRVMDHLGDYMSFGQPFVMHNQAPRNICSDVVTERKGMHINETLWKKLQAIDLYGKTYLMCAWELADRLGWEFKEQFAHYLRFLEDLR